MLVGFRFSTVLGDSYPWLVVDEDDIFLYAVYLLSSSRFVKRIPKAVLGKGLLHFVDTQLTLF